jgi:hypothetical protein
MMVGGVFGRLVESRARNYLALRIQVQSQPNPVVRSGYHEDPAFLGHAESLARLLSADRADRQRSRQMMRAGCKTVIRAAPLHGSRAQVLFSGVAPGSVGEYQLNALVPAGSSKGEAVPVVIAIGGANVGHGYDRSAMTHVMTHRRKSALIRGPREFLQRPPCSME